MAAKTPAFDFQVAIEKCELCQEEDAQFYCNDCQEEMCSGCKTAHLRSKASRGHNVVSTRLGKTIGETRKPIKCTTHQSEIIRMYCTSCDETVCVKCVTDIKHKNHNFEQLETTLYRKKDQRCRSTQKHEKKDQKKQTDDRASCTSVTTISIDIVSKINPGIISECVSAVNDSEAWCSGERNLVLIDIHGNVKRKRQLDEEVRDIAVTTKGEIFVTLWDGTGIMKYLQDDRCINIADTQPYCIQGICLTSAQGKILVCLYKRNDSKVVRMTTAGEIKQTIQKDKQHQSLYKHPFYVAENINEDVVVADGSFPSAIVVVNKKGEYRYTYPDSSQSSHRIDGCYGIACDNTGCVLVSDYCNNRIHQIDMDGRFIQFILTQQHGVQIPRGLSIDNKGQLWLCNSHGKEITIYKYRSS